MKFIIMVVLSVTLALVGSPALADCGAHHGDHAKACPMKDKNVVETSDVAMSGEVLCMHCDLQKAEACHKVFVAGADEEMLYEICPESDVDITEMSGKIEISGEMRKADDGTVVLHVAAAKKADA